MQLDRFDFQAEMKLFVSVKPSEATRRIYGGSLRILESWLVWRSLSLTELTPALAGEFIRDLMDGKLSGSPERSGHCAPSRARSIVVACSSFCAHLVRRYADIENPFRGAQATLASFLPDDTWPAPPVH